MADLAVIIPVATSALALVGAGVSKVWSAIQQSRLDCMERCASLVLEKQDLQAQLKAEQKEHWKTAMALERLLGKYERERGSGSPPPQT